MPRFEPSERYAEQLAGVYDDDADDGYDPFEPDTIEEWEGR